MPDIFGTFTFTMTSDPTQQFLEAVQHSTREGSFLKVTLGNYAGNEKELKNIYIRKVKIKHEPKFSFTYRYKTRDIVKNMAPEELNDRLSHFISNDFKVANLFTTHAELQFERLPSGKMVLREKPVATANSVSEQHDKAKQRLIKPTGKPYLQALKIADASGNIFNSAQDKFRQINKYIEILAPLVKEAATSKIQHVVDMGSGKGYLTFALYDYLHNVLGLKAKVTGVEFRPDMVELCNGISQTSGFDQLDFVEGTIGDFDEQNMDLLIALHACDTATDDAIFKGISAGAKLIVVAPCCHKQVRREMEKGRINNDVSFLTRHGIFMERQAEMVTDGIRALILEYFGYKTKVFEFISDAHTPKNLLIVGVKGAESLRTKDQGDSQRAKILAKIKAAKEFFGIGYHHLEKLMFPDKGY